MRLLNMGFLGLLAALTLYGNNGHHRGHDKQNAH